MKVLGGIGRFLYDFVVGDDWVGAAGVVVVLGGIALLAHAGANPWWLVPPGVVAVLSLTLRRAVS